MPVTNFMSLTTIGNLYDVLAILFSGAQTELRKPHFALQAACPYDNKLQEYYAMAKNIFLEMKDNFPELDEFFSSDDTELVVRKYRGQHGGSALFRPIGLEIFSRIIARLTKDMSLSGAVREAAKLPTTLTSQPFRELMWDVSNRTMSNSHKVTVRELLLYMLGKAEFSGCRGRIQEQEGGTHSQGSQHCGHDQLPLCHSGRGTRRRIGLCLTLYILLETKFYRRKPHDYRVRLQIAFPVFSPPAIPVRGPSLSAA